MALSRIWSAFILIAVFVAASKAAFFGNNQIFSQMVVGKADDAYDTVRYVMVGSPASTGITSKENFAKYLSGYGYVAADSAHLASVIITDDVNSDSVAAIKSATGSNAVFTYKSVQTKLVKKADGIIETCKSAVNISIGLIGIMALFMGFMSIAERAGGIRLLSKIIGPFFSRLFPDIPKGHPAMGHMMMNFSANLLGLDNAATPFGIKSMESLQEINTDKDVASNAQIMFLCLHAAGFSLIPVSIIAVRASLKSANPTDIFVPCMITTFVATMAAMFMVSFKQKIRIFQPVILAWVGGLSAILVLLVVYLTSLNAAAVQSFSNVLSNGLILLIFLLIILGALYKRIDVFDAFIDGAKGGFETSVRIIPYLVGMLVAISLLRTSGTFDVVINGMKSLFAALGADTRFVDGLPTALIRPLSGGGARGMMVDTMKNFGADSFAGRLASILQGSSDTTFYVIAVYFGAVGIKNTRYAVGAMLLADLVGILTAITLAYLFFGNV
ncbi:spore maturation protein [Segetibacter sp.]|jgi:spore maturation protein SpmA/spore maturation protein SpmB|uniref:nucleoside recognition domain-containing protein n=1 Tax=Segetibacter sp. TaxID=2231182 RepID=UPI0026098732|nr:spore maturation protein [Segetibacter sp.]MCW3078759.1 spore maturation protein [Segetibacter sp.]